MSQVGDVVVRKLRYRSCVHCSALALPADERVEDRVEADQDPRLGLVMRLLFWLRFQWLKRDVPVVRSKSAMVLDIGCGDGQLLRYLQTLGYRSLKGVEPELDRQANASRHNIPVMSSIADIDDEKFDLILMWHVLEHIEQPIEFLKRVSKMIAPGGTLIVSVPNQASWQTRWFGFYSSFLDYGRHRWYWDRTLIEQLRRVEPTLRFTQKSGTNFEYEVFGWVDSLAGFLLKRRNIVHRWLKKREGSSIDSLFILALAMLLLPVAVLMAVIVPLTRESTLTFMVERSSNG